MFMDLFLAPPKALSKNDVIHLKEHAQREKRRDEVSCSYFNPRSDDIK